MSSQTNESQTSAGNTILSLIIVMILGALICSSLIGNSQMDVLILKFPPFGSLKSSINTIDQICTPVEIIEGPKDFYKVELSNNKGGEDIFASLIRSNNVTEFCIAGNQIYNALSHSAGPAWMRVWVDKENATPMQNVNLGLRQ
jgi:hypothetical protein